MSWQCKQCENNNKDASQECEKCGAKAPYLKMFQYTLPSTTFDPILLNWEMENHQWAKLIYQGFEIDITHTKEAHILSEKGEQMTFLLGNEVAERSFIYDIRGPRPILLSEDENEEDMKDRLQSFKVEGVSFNMIRVKGGSFLMGATPEMEEAWDEETPVHKVTLSDYFIGETEVTQSLWTAVMGNKPFAFRGADLPAENISWDDCNKFIERLNQLTGKQFRFPTEAEWEFAARGGSKSKHTQYSGGKDIDEVAWHEGNSNGGTHPVATKKPNELALYDMSGSVWEWCQDWFGAYSGADQTNPTGPENGSSRVFRGGCWINDANFCRVSSRSNSIPSYKNRALGLRLAL